MEIKLYSVKKRILSYGSARFEKRRFFFQEKVFLTCQSFIFHALKYWQHSSFHKTLGSAWSCQAKMAFVRHVKRFQSGKIRVKKMTQEEFLTVSICFKMLRMSRQMESIFLWNHIPKECSEKKLTIFTPMFYIIKSLIFNQSFSGVLLIHIFVENHQ